MIYRFGDFALDTVRGELTQNGAAVAVEPQVFAQLAGWAERHRRIVEARYARLDDVLAALTAVTDTDTRTEGPPEASR